MGYCPEASQQVSEELLGLADAAGLRARLQGRSSATNPFDPGAEARMHQAWQAGWNDRVVPPAVMLPDRGAVDQRCQGES